MIFQFLLVRLKVVNTFTSLTTSTISIPSGTIKSHSGSLSIASIMISIPSGTIKSKWSQAVGKNPMAISIPSGTIKSFVCYIKIGLIVVFQFLLVRLKVGCVHNRPTSFVFQFLLVRLKELKKWKQSRRWKNFNSFWYD